MSKIHELYLTFVDTGDGSNLADYIKENPQSINDQDDEGKTVLHLAISYNSLDNVLFFLQHGADVKIKDKDDNSPLNEAYRYGNYKIFDTVLEHGGNIEERDSTRATFLHSAFLLQKLDKVQFLLSRGADVHTSDYSLFEDCLQIYFNHNFDNIALLQQLFKWGFGFGHEFIGIEFKPGQTDNMIILGSTFAEAPITRQTPGFERAITNFQELEQSIKANIGINFDLLPEPATLKKFIHIKDVAEFYEPYCKLYNNLTLSRGLKKLSLFAIQNQPDKFTIEDLQKLPDELYKQINIKLFKHKSN